MDEAANALETSPAGQSPAPTSVILSEHLLESFARAMQVARFDETLFDFASGGDLAKKLTDLVSAVASADVDAMVRGQRYGRALLGGDVEARIKFALGRKAARSALVAAEAAAKLTSTRLQALNASLQQLNLDKERLSSVARKAQALARSLETPKTRDAQELKDRFDRRCVNLSALQASTTLTLAQVPIAITHFRHLLDQFVDVKTVLFPVWERHALALVQSPRDVEALNAVRSAARALGERLIDRLGPSA